jgi:hypothetical protein
MVILTVSPVVRRRVDKTVEIRHGVEMEKVEDSTTATFGRSDVNANDIGVSGITFRVLKTNADNSCAVDFLASNGCGFESDHGSKKGFIERKYGRLDLNPGDKLILTAHPDFHAHGVTGYSVTVKELEPIMEETQRIDFDETQKINFDDDETQDESALILKPAPIIVLGTPSTADSQEQKSCPEVACEESLPNVWQDSGNDIYDQPTDAPVRKRVIEQEESDAEEEEEDSDEERRREAVKDMIRITRKATKVIERAKKEMVVGVKAAESKPSSRRKRCGDTIVHSDSDKSSDDSSGEHTSDAEFIENDMTREKKPIVDVLLGSVTGTMLTAKALRTLHAHKILGDPTCGKNRLMVPKECTQLMDVFTGQNLLDPLERMETKKKHRKSLVDIRATVRNFEQNKAVDDMCRDGASFYNTPSGFVHEYEVYAKRKSRANLRDKADVLDQFARDREARNRRSPAVADSDPAPTPPTRSRNWRRVAVKDGSRF